MASATVTNYGSFGVNTQNELETVFLAKESGSPAQTVVPNVTFSGNVTVSGSLTAASGGIAAPVPVVVTGSTDAILFPNANNLVIVTPGSGTDACTLATPVAGDNGKLLTIINGTAGANTVTTASGKILDGSATAKDTVTFGAHVGATIVLQAYNLFWQLIASSNATLTAV